MPTHQDLDQNNVRNHKKVITTSNIPYRIHWSLLEALWVRAACWCISVFRRQKTFKLRVSYFHRLLLTLEVLFQRQSLVPPTHYQLLHQALCGTGPCIGNASNGADRINVLTLMRQGGSLSRLAWEQRESHPRTVRVCAPVGRLAQILLIALDLHLSHNMSFQFFLISFVATFLIGLENT